MTRDSPGHVVRNWTAPTKRAHELLTALSRGELINGDPSPEMTKLIKCGWVLYDGHDYEITEPGRNVLRTWNEMETH